MSMHGLKKGDRVMVYGRSLAREYSGVGEVSRTLVDGVTVKFLVTGETCFDGRKVTLDHEHETRVKTTLPSELDCERTACFRMDMGRQGREWRTTMDSMTRLVWWIDLEHAPFDPERL